MITKMAYEFVKAWEVFSATPYQCAADKWTIGYGHVIQPWESFSEIDQTEAVELLQQDGQTALDTMQRLDTKERPYRYDAIFSLVFNVGTSFLYSNTRKYLEYGEYEMMAVEWMDFNKINGRPSLGLQRRRMDELKLFFGRFEKVQRIDLTKSDYEEEANE